MTIRKKLAVATTTATAIIVCVGILISSILHSCSPSFEFLDVTYANAVSFCYLLIIAASLAGSIVELVCLRTKPRFLFGLGYIMIGALFVTALVVRERTRPNKSMSYSESHHKTSPEVPLILKKPLPKMRAALFDDGTWQMFIYKKEAFDSACERFNSLLKNTSQVKDSG